MIKYKDAIYVEAVSASKLHSAFAALVKAVSGKEPSGTSSEPKGESTAMSATDHLGGKHVYTYTPAPKKS